MGEEGVASSYAAWREQLAPWLVALRCANLDFKLPSLATVSDFEELWIQVKAPDKTGNTPHGWSLFAEALELLELLARVDHCAAWYLLLEIARQPQWVEQLGELRDALPDHLPKFLVQVSDAAFLEPGESTLFGLCRLILPEATVASSTYEAVKQSLLEKYAATHNSASLNREINGHVKLSLDVEVSMEFDDESAVQRVFSQLSAAVGCYKNPERIRLRGDSDSEDDPHGKDTKTRQDTDASDVVALTRQHDEPNVTAGPVTTRTSRVRGPFAFESFRIKISSPSPLTNHALYLINQAGESRVPLSHFSVSALSYAQLHSSVIGNFTIIHLSPRLEQLRGCGIRSLTLDLGEFDEAAVRGFCTAIARNRDLEAFAFEFGDATNEVFPVAAGNVWWRWLAYALFSRGTAHSIRSVVLNLARFENLDFVDGMREVLAQSDPLTFLYEPLRVAELDQQGQPPTEVAAAAAAKTTKTTTAPAMVALFNKTASIRLGFYRADAPHALSIEQQGVTYQVVRNRLDEAFIEFVLPGVGVCWTDRSELVELRPAPQHESHSVRHLTLQYLDEETVAPAITLLELIGGPLERLTIHDLEGAHYSDDLFAAVWRCCPNLKRLDITAGDVETLDWLFEPIDNAPRLETLCMDGMNVSDRASWSTLFKTLSDPQHQLTQSLRQLHVGFRHPSHDPEWPAFEDATLRQCLKMLDKNMQLLRCDLLPSSNELATEYEKRCKIHHNGYMPEQDAPLGPIETLAFLGGVTLLEQTESDPSSRKHPRTYHDRHCTVGLPARYKLSSEISRLILAFAATPKRRVCTIHERQPEFPWS